MQLKTGNKPMKVMKFTIASTLLCNLLISILQTGCSKNSVNAGDNILTGGFDTLSVSNYAIDKDTIIMRPLYRINDSFTERLVDSFFSLDPTVPDVIFFHSRKHPEYYILSSSFHIDSIDSINGVYWSRNTNCSVTIYNMTDSILEGFGFDKINDSVNIYLTKPELIAGKPDYLIYLKERKPGDESLMFAVIRGISPIDFNKCDELRWLNDYVKPAKADGSTSK